MMKEIKNKNIFKFETNELANELAASKRQKQLKVASKRVCRSIK